MTAGESDGHGIVSDSARPFSTRTTFPERQLGSVATWLHSTRPTEETEARCLAVQLCRRSGNWSHSVQMPRRKVPTAEGDIPSDVKADRGTQQERASEYSMTKRFKVDPVSVFTRQGSHGTKIDSAEASSCQPTDWRFPHVTVPFSSTLTRQGSSGELWKPRRKGSETEPCLSFIVREMCKLEPSIRECKM